MFRITRSLLLVSVMAALAALAVAQERGPRPHPLGRRETWDYAAAMRAVAAKFTGTTGVVLHLGDSITYASPYTAWARAGNGKTREQEDVLRWSHCGEQNDRDGWYLASHDAADGRSLTAASGIRADQYLAGGFRGLPSLAEIIRRYRPQVAIVMLGTNDAAQHRTPEAYGRDMDAIITALLDHGTVVILSTIPPIYSDREAAPAYNAILWRLARTHNLPVIDFYGEILARRPGTTWNGTLLNMDNVHPTADQAGVTPTSAPTVGNLRESGYLLRGWLSVEKLIEVRRRALAAP
jgi:lysophospholipase L1-like esterase